MFSFCGAEKRTNKCGQQSVTLTEKGKLRQEGKLSLQVVIAKTPKNHKLLCP